MSSYPLPELAAAAKEHGWFTRTVEQRVSVNKGYGKKKVEVLTANYPI